MGVMDHGDAAHRVTAARQRDPQLLPHFNLVGVRDLVRHRDLLVGDESVKDVAGDVVESVAGPDLVDGMVAGGYAGAVGAGAGEADANGGAGRYGGGEVGVGGKAVVAKKGAEGADLEEGLDSGVGGGVGGHVAEECPARGPRGGVAGEPRRLC